MCSSTNLIGQTVNLECNHFSSWNPTNEETVPTSSSKWVLFCEATFTTQTHTHKYAILNGHFPGESGLASWPFDFYRHCYIVRRCGDCDEFVMVCVCWSVSGWTSMIKRKPLIRMTWNMSVALDTVSKPVDFVFKKSRVMSTSLCMFWLLVNPWQRAFIANIYPCQRRSTAALICTSTVLVILHLFLDYAFFHGTGRNSSPWYSSTKPSLDDVSFPLTSTIIQRYGVWPNQHHPSQRAAWGWGRQVSQHKLWVIIGMETRGLHRVGGVYVGLVPCSMQTPWGWV